MRKNSTLRPGAPWRTGITAALVAGLIGVSAAGAVAAPSDGTLDQAFQAETGSGFDGVVTSLALQEDGKILTAGNFYSFDGTIDGKFARLNADGSVDTAFAAEIGGGPNGWQGAVEVQPDGKILTGGQQQTWDGLPMAYFSRLNADGSRDTAFNANLVAANLGFNVGQTITVQPDGKIILGAGDGVARVNEDGTRDQAFTDALGAGITSAGGTPSVYASEVLPNGDIIVGGNFVSLGGNPSARLALLHADGSFDATFAANLGGGFDGTVSAIAPLSDGSLVVGGSFTTVNGVAAAGVALLNADGTVNTEFADTLGTGFDKGVNDVVLTPEGAILVAGAFYEVNGIESAKIARISAAGVVDTAFSAGIGSGFDGEVAEVAIQPNGAIVAVGFFTSYNGEAAGNIARLSYTPGISIVNPGAQSSKVNSEEYLPIVATHTDGEGSFTYSAEGLPPGLSIDPATGIISGTETAAGEYTVTVTATHSGGATASTTFVWTVEEDDTSNPGNGNNGNNNGNNVGQGGNNSGNTDGAGSGASPEALATTGAGSNAFGAGLFAAAIAALGGALLVLRRHQLAKR